MSEAGEEELKMSKRKYDLLNLENAIKDVRNKLLNATQASQEYGVPRQTIMDNIDRDVDLLGKRGPEKMLTLKEEEALVAYVKYMGERGFPLNRQHLRSYVLELIKRADRNSLFNLDKGPSDKWCLKFIRNHPELSEKTPQIRDKGRTRMSNQTVMDEFFKKYEETIDHLQLRNKPAQIFNCDETGFVDKQGTSRKVIGQKGRPCIQQQIHTIDHVTAHMCVCGDGSVMPTFIIYQKALPHRPYREDVPRTWMFGVSDSGYMDSDLFLMWFKNVFVKHCGKERPVLLLFDNHDSHIGIPVIEMARAEQIEILAFPAHTTHLLQPLDVNVFGPLKEKMRCLATSMALINSQMCVSKATLPCLMSYAIDQICSPGMIKSAFRKTGLIPLNQEAIDKSHLLPEDFQKTSSAGAQKSSENKVTTISTCETCGASTLPHPIPEVRELPPVMQSIFVTPMLPKKAPAKKRRVVTEARVITGDQMLDQLKKKDADEKEKREGIERRKKEREEKRKEKENEKSRKNGKKKAKTQVCVNIDDESEGEDDLDVVCGKCGLRDPESEESDVDIESTSWIQCESCDKWYHESCVKGLVTDVFQCDECE